MRGCRIASSGNWTTTYVAPGWQVLDWRMIVNGSFVLGHFMFPRCSATPRNQIKACMLCEKPFTAFRRRHHCRECSKGWRRIHGPERIQRLPVAESEGVLSDVAVGTVTGWLRLPVICDSCSSHRIIVPRRSLTKPTRACDECYAKLASGGAGAGASHAVPNRPPNNSGPTTVDCFSPLCDADALLRIRPAGPDGDAKPSGAAQASPRKAATAAAGAAANGAGLAGATNPPKRPPAAHLAGVSVVVILPGRR